MAEIYKDDRNVGREVRDDVKRSAERLKEDARDAAEDVTARVQDEALHQADRAKSGAASEMSGIAQALRTAAEEMRSGSPQARSFGQIAQSLEGASEALRDRDFGDLANDVSGFARRNPMGFLGGAALVGFVATRFAQASTAPRGTGTHRDAEPEGHDRTAGGMPGAHAGAAAPRGDGPTTAAPVVPAKPKTPGEF